MLVGGGGGSGGGVGMKFEESEREREETHLAGCASTFRARLFLARFARANGGGTIDWGDEQAKKFEFIRSS